MNPLIEVLRSVSVGDLRRCAEVRMEGVTPGLLIKRPSAKTDFLLFPDVKDKGEKVRSTELVLEAIERLQISRLAAIVEVRYHRAAWSAVIHDARAVNIADLAARCLQDRLNQTDRRTR